MIHNSKQGWQAMGHSPRIVTSVSGPGSESETGDRPLDKERYCYKYSAEGPSGQDRQYQFEWITDFGLDAARWTT